MRVNHGRAHVLVSQQFLNGPNVIAILQQMSRKRMSQRMTSSRFGDGLQSCFLEGALQNRFMKMVPAFLARYPVCEMTRCGKHPLPAPFLARIRVFTFKSIR
jgi:hypothetical protein